MARLPRLLVVFLAAAGIAAVPTGAGAAKPAAAKHAAAATDMKVQADLRQLMRGILFPNSNVLFAAQNDLSNIPGADDPTLSPNPLNSSFGGWEAVENSALALSEAANLLLIPGRLCSNGRPAPLGRADWPKFVQGLRDASAAAYKAAKTKSQDAMVDVSETVTEACSACHQVYRDKEDKGGDANRCLP